MGFKAADYEDCREKCRCVEGPNVGTVYTKEDPCEEDFLFVDEGCLCIPPNAQRIQARAYDFKNCEWPVAFDRYNRWNLNTHPFSVYGGWNQYTNECPYVDLVSPFMSTLTDGDDERYKFIPFIDADMGYKFFSASMNSSWRGVCESLAACDSYNHPCATGQGGGCNLTSSEASLAMITQHSAAWGINGYSTGLDYDTPFGTPQLNAFYTDNHYPQIPAWTERHVMRKQNLARRTNVGEIDDLGQPKNFASMEFYAFDSRNRPCSVYESDSPIWVSGGGPQWNNIGGKEGSTGYYTGLFELGRVHATTINTQGDLEETALQFFPREKRFGNSCEEPQDPIGTEYSLRFQWRYQNPKYVVDKDGGSYDPDNEQYEDYWVYVKNPGRVPTVPRATDHDGFFRGVGSSCAS